MTFELYFTSSVFHDKSGIANEQFNTLWISLLVRMLYFLDDTPNIEWN